MVLLHLYSVLDFLLDWHLLCLFLNQVNAQKQKGQAVDPASALKAIDVLKVSYSCID